MSLFQKVQNNAGRLFNKAMSKNGIFNKINTLARQGDNTVQRVGHLLRPIASQFGVGDIVDGVVNRVHDVASHVRNTNQSIRNNLERAVKAPMSDINSNYA